MVFTSRLVLHIVATRLNRFGHMSMAVFLGKKEEELKDIQKSTSASGSGGAQSKEKQERMVSEEERRKKEKEELEKKRGLQKGPQLVAKGAKWEPTGP